MRPLQPARAVEYLALVLGLALVLVILSIRLASDGLLEKGDGVMHYLITRYTWRHPALFLDLWGKPLFNILASPFAQAGHVGVAVFNVVVAAFTAWVGTIALRKAGGATQVLFPFLVLLAPQYVLMVMAGMTEPLFGLVTVITVLLLIIERPVPAALVASLAPFARPEYIAFLPAVVVWLLWRKQWRALPWCLFGFTIYAVCATIHWGDPLWFWTSDPYGQAGGVYGSGPLDFFVHRAEQVFGRPLLTASLVALALWPIIWWADRTERRTHLMLLITAAGPAIGIVAIHSILWYVGTRGSAGLLRVLVTAVPLTALFAAMTLGRGGLLLLANVKQAKLIATIACLGMGMWCCSDLLTQQELPIKADHSQRLLDTVAGDAKAHYKPGIKIFSTHPYMAFGGGFDPFDPTIYNMIYGFDHASIERNFKIGDLLVWDSQLGSNEAGVKLDMILNDGRFTVLNTYEPREGYRVIGGFLYELFIFERRNAVRTFTVDTLMWNGIPRNGLHHRVDRVDCPDTANNTWCFDGSEFQLEFDGLPMPSLDGLYDEWIVSAKTVVKEGAPLAIVLKQTVDGQDIRYDQEAVPNGELVFSRRVPVLQGAADLKIYFWNMGRQPFTLQGVNVLRKRWVQRPA